MKRITMPLSALVPDPDQPRKSLPAAELDQLVASIRDRGLLQPPRVKPANAEGQHVIVSGHLRYAALVKLGAATVDCIIVDGPLDEATVLERFSHWCSVHQCHILRAIFRVSATQNREPL